MKRAEIREAELDSEYPSLDDIASFLDQQGTLINIDTINWKMYDYQPKVIVSLAYTSREILLKFYIAEEHFRAEKTETNDNVFEDSCVEFFVAPDTGGLYYNFEFNGLGTCLLGSGKDRSDRKRVDPSVIAQIRRITSPGALPVKEKEEIFEWTITIAIPVKIFLPDITGSLKGSTMRANFYKCGDKLKVPHYLSWNPVVTEKPDFHRPDCFGELIFL